MNFFRFFIDSSALIVKISQPDSCNIPGTSFEVLLYVLQLVSSTAATTKKTAPPKGQAWRLNKSACNSANTTYRETFY